MKESLEFHLVPVSGTLKGSGGYRAEVKKDFRNRVIDFDGVIAETLNEHHWNVDPELLKLYIRGVLYAMLKNTAKDGCTRKIDEFFSVNLNIHGRFEKKSDDFDPARHKLRLVLRPLAAFRVLGPKRNVVPVNVNRILQFRITSFTAADGLHKNRTVVFGQDIVVKGTNLMIDESKGGFVSLNIHYSRGSHSRDDVVSRGVEAKVISHTEREIRIAWPEDVDIEEARGQRLTVAVWKAIRGQEMDKNRSATAWIHLE